jgi:hypothetical protein
VVRVPGFLVALVIAAGALAACTSAPPGGGSLGQRPCLEPDRHPAPGDVVCFSGQLDEPLKIDTGGTPEAPITYRGNGAVVPGIQVRADNVVVEGFVSRGADSTGIWVQGENITVQNNEITQVRYVGEDLDAMRFFGDGAKILNNWVHDLEGTSEIGDSHIDCVQSFATSGPGSSNVLIQGNRCEGIRAQCLMAEGPNVEDGSGEGVSENWVFDGNYCDSHADAQSVSVQDIQHVTISNNDMVGTGNKAFALGQGSTDVTIKDNKIGPGYGREVGFDDDSVEEGYQGPPAEE